MPEQKAEPDWIDSDDLLNLYSQNIAEEFPEKQWLEGLESLKTFLRKKRGEDKSSSYIRGANDQRKNQDVEIHRLWKKFKMREGIE